MPLFDTTTTDAIPHARAATREEATFPALVRFFPTISVHRLPRTGTLTLGRRADASLVLPYRRASRDHAVIHVERTDAPTVHDLGSKNGTHVNAHRISPDTPRLLADGDVLRAGGALFVFRAHARTLPELEHDADAPHGLVGPVHMRAIHRAIDEHARTDHRVLLLGETGTGKDVVARAIAAASRPSAPFVALNVAAIPRDLFEAELFGHRRGAFSGATEARLGAFRTANEGVLFLDEVGDLPLDCQVKLLRVIEERQIRPVGADRTVAVDVRIVAATERPLRDMVLASTFRASLYNRLREVELTLAPLRARAEDLPSLVAHLLARAPHAARVAPDAIDPEALEALACHPFPGNVRELAAVLQEAARVATTDHLDAAAIRAALAARTVTPAREAGLAHTANTTALDPAAHAERTRLLTALETHAYNIRRTAVFLGRPRSYVYRAARRLGISLRRQVGDGE